MTKELEEVEQVQYTWDEYAEDIQIIVRHLECKFKSVHIVSIYRGSLGMGAHLSNIMGVPLSIVKFQSYGKNNDKEVTFLHNADIRSSDLIIIVDDLIDSGNTLTKVYDFLENEFPITNIESITIHGDPKTNSMFPRNMYLRAKEQNIWMQYPWEI